MPRRRSHGFLGWFMELHIGVKIATAFLAFFIAMGSAAATWDSFGWWKPASIQYVNEMVKPLIRSVLDSQIELAEGKRDATDENIFKWQDKLKETTDPERKREYQERLHELELTKRRQDQQIKTLMRARGP